MRREMAHAVSQFFQAHKREMVAPILAAYGNKARQRKSADEDLKAEIEALLAKLDLAPMEDLPDGVQRILEDMAKDGAHAALLQVGSEGFEDLVKLVNDQAVEWAAQRAAELVGMRRLPDGTLIENPDAEWAIDESTRDGIRSEVTQALEEGWSNDRLAKELSDSFAFSEERADTIARTEIAYADAASHQIAWQDAGVTGKQWLRSNEGYECDICEGNAQDGVIPLDDTFSSGDAEEPAHPNCECVVVPVVDDEEGVTP